MISQTKSGRDSSALTWLQYLVYGSIILYVGRNIFIPISFALLVSFILYPICLWLERRGIGRAMAIVLSLLLVIVLGISLALLLVYQVVGFIEEWPSIQQKLSLSISELRQSIENFGITQAEQSQLMKRVTDQSGSKVISILQSTATASAFSILLLVLIPVYTFLILYFRRYWMLVLSNIFPSEKMEDLREMISLTIQSYYNFVKGMAIVYIIVGVLNSLGLFLLGVPHAILFGFVAAILTFIPYVGIMVGSLLPMAMAWITYDSIWYPIGIAALFTFVQYLEANIIFPIAVSSRLNINTLIMLVAIFVGGILWGMAGMILFVPFAGIAKLIADRNPKLKTVAMILGTGK